MPLLLIPFALFALFVWFVLSRKATPTDALLASPELPSSLDAPSIAGGSPAKALKGASSSRALPREAKRALPPA